LEAFFDFLEAFLDPLRLRFPPTVGAAVSATPILLSKSEGAADMIYDKCDYILNEENIL
jgi:hypothetical protein